jgi:hypothetical protein
VDKSVKNFKRVKSREFREYYHKFRDKYSIAFVYLVIYVTDDPIRSVGEIEDYLENRVSQGSLSWKAARKFFVRLYTQIAKESGLSREDRRKAITIARRLKHL